MAVINSCPLCGGAPGSYSDEGHYYIECSACTEGHDANGFWMTHELYDFLTRSGHPFQTVRKRLPALLEEDVGTSRLRPMTSRHAEHMMSAG